MKIALITTDNREHSKDYSTPRPYFGTAPAALIEGFEYIPETELHVISCARKGMASPEKLAQNVWFHSLTVPKLGWMRTAYQGCIRAVRSKLREIRPDIVHGQGTERDCAIDAALCGFPNLLTIHGNMRAIARANHARPFSYMWLNAHLERLTIPLAGGVVCITNYTRSAVEAIARRTWLVPNAVDARFFGVERTAAAPQDGPPTLLVVANICHHKNQNGLIRALDGIARDRAFKLVFLGNASKEQPYGAEFHELIASRPWCQWGGFTDREGLCQWLARVDALVLPSIEDNCPMAILEAMAAGVPVMASNIGGVPDLVRPGETGALFDPADAESMASAVREFLAHREKACSMAAKAKEEALERFHPRCVAQRHLEIYREVLSTSR